MLASIEGLHNMFYYSYVPFQIHASDSYAAPIINHNSSATRIPDTRAIATRAEWHQHCGELQLSMATLSDQSFRSGA